MDKSGYELGSDMYMFHQTPAELAADLMQFVPLEASDRCYEPFAGEDAFFNAFPVSLRKDWSEITRGRCYKDYDKEYDWVITNPPFKIPFEIKKKHGVFIQERQFLLKNAIFPLLLYFAARAKKGIAFLVSDYAFNSLTPVRIAKMKALGFYLQSLTTCAVKEWRGRYIFMVWTKTPTNFLTCLTKTYSNVAAISKGPP